MTAAKILWDTFNETRNLSLYYFNKQKDTDTSKCFEVNGVRLNSAKWVVAHLVWAEHMLVLDALGGKKVEIDWLGQVAFGTDAEKAVLPSIDVILADMNRVHTAATSFVESLTDEFLEEKNALGLKFGPNESKRYMLMHAIRHEGTHTGHLGWLSKIAASR